MVHKFNIKESGYAVNRFRSVASQILACTSANLLLLSLGIAVSFSTIAIPDLLNAPEGLSLDESQASWFGSIGYLTQPLGAVFSGPIVDYFGRKKANFLVNIPHLVAWVLMYYSWNLPSLLMASALLGLGNGVMEAPINSYVGEISEPSLRGSLCTVTQLFSSAGGLVIFFLGTVVNWRTAALISLAIPIASMIFTLMIPETPVWLLVRGREKEALKSLCYLRGWTTIENVREEFDTLSTYSKNLQQCVLCTTPTQDCEHMKMNFVKRWIFKFRHVILVKETLRPLTLIMMYFTFYSMSGYIPIRPNLVNICGALGMPKEGKDIAFMVGILTFCTSLIVIGLIRVLGKRKLALSAMLGNAISCGILSYYIKKNLSDSVSSYDTSTFPEEKSYFPLVLLYTLAIFYSIAVPWVMLGEVFPFRSRASAQGFAAAWNYVVTFCAAKIFINLETGLHLWGTFAFYSAVATIGTVYLYFLCPETEGKTLQHIESYFNGKFRTFANDPFINLFKRFKKK